MNRRTFLKQLMAGAALASSAPWLGRAAAQTAGTPGVSGDEILIGMSADLSGAIRDLGIEYYRGAKAFYDDVNARGGVYGRALRVVALDDVYNPLQTIENTIELVEETQVFCLSNYTGSPTMARTLPVIKLYERDNLVLIGNLSGALPQRRPPYDTQVYNIRPSYPQESRAVVERLWDSGVRRFGVFYQIDAFGRAGAAGVYGALAERGAEVTAEATYLRDDTSSMEQQMAFLRDADVEVVVCAAVTEPYANIIGAARDSGWAVPFTNLSVTPTLLQFLDARSQQTGRDYTRNILSSQVVPSIETTGLPGVARYRALMDRYQPEPPVQSPPNYVAPRYGETSFEGALNAQVLVEALRRAGPDLTRAGFVAALNGMSALTLDIGAPISFAPGDLQGLEQVYFAYPRQGRWLDTNDVAGALGLAAPL